MDLLILRALVLGPGATLESVHVFPNDLVNGLHSSFLGPGLPQAVDSRARKLGSIALNSASWSGGYGRKYVHNAVLCCREFFVVPRGAVSLRLYPAACRCLSTGFTGIRDTYIQKNT